MSHFFVFFRHVSSRLRRRRHKCINPPPWNTLPVCIHEHTVNLRRSHECLPPWLLPLKLTGCANAGAHRVAVQRIKFHGSGAPGFSNSSKTRAKPSTYETTYIMTWLSSSGRGVSFGASVGSTAPAKERSQSVERPKGIFLRGRFGQNPGFNNIWHYSPYIPHFLFCGQCSTGAYSVFVPGFASSSVLVYSIGARRQKKRERQSAGENKATKIYTERSDISDRSGRSDRSDRS